MTRQEWLVLLLVCSVVLVKVGFLWRDVAIASTYGPGGPPPYEMELWKQASLAWSAIVNLAAGVWLFVEARAEALRGWVWGLLGITFGLIGILLFYVVQLYHQGITMRSTRRG